MTKICILLLAVLGSVAVFATTRESQFGRIKKELPTEAGDSTKGRCRCDQLGESEQALDLIRDVTLLVSKYLKRLCPADVVSECTDNESGNESQVDKCGSVNIKSANKKDFVVTRCVLDSAKELQDHFVIESPPTSKWQADSFCQAASVTKIEAKNNYTLAVKLYADGHADKGHIGVMFNGVDKDNYDFVYVRTHSPSYQTGRLLDAAIDFSDTRAGTIAKSQPKQRNWFEIVVEVTPKNAAVYLDGGLIVNMPPKYPLGGLVGVVVGNGYKDRVNFKDLTVDGC